MFDPTDYQGISPIRPEEKVGEGSESRAEITREIKKYAKSLGADLVGIAPMSRFEGAPKQMDPRYIMPEAKSCIALGFRVLRGSLRGIEEGTFFSNYSSMGYGAITYIFMPTAVVNLCRYIEDHGYEAFPMGHQSDWRAIDNEGRFRNGFSKPVAPGLPAPDIMVHLRIAGYLCGLGEIGWSKMLLTPEFGPAQRVGLIFTELELDYDPIYDGPKLCNKCMACVRHCPGGAISADKSIKTTAGGHDLNGAKLIATNVMWHSAERSKLKIHHKVPISICPATMLSGQTIFHLFIPRPRKSTAQAKPSAGPAAAPAPVWQASRRAAFSRSK